MNGFLSSIGINSFWVEHDRDLQFTNNIGITYKGFWAGISLPTIIHINFIIYLYISYTT